MELNYINELPLGGFDFDNCIRNEALMANAAPGAKIQTKKTGTTICGVVFNVSGRHRGTLAMG